VAPLEIRDLHQLAEFRFILERGVCELLMNAPRDWTRVRELSAELRAPGLTSDEIVDANVEFHLSLARLTGNDQLSHALKRVLEDSARFFRLGTPYISADDMANDHDQLLNALERSDMEAASKICHSEAYGTRDRVINILLASSSDLPGVSLGSLPRQSGHVAK
jgi:DNA-binding GntR family transcriptional regulator